MKKTGEQHSTETAVPFKKVVEHCSLAFPSSTDFMYLTISWYAGYTLIPLYSLIYLISLDISGNTFHIRHICQIFRNSVIKRTFFDINRYISGDLSTYLSIFLYFGSTCFPLYLCIPWLAWSFLHIYIWQLLHILNNSLTQLVMLCCILVYVKKLFYF